MKSVYFCNFVTGSGAGLASCCGGIQEMWSTVACEFEGLASAALY